MSVEVLTEKIIELELQLKVTPPFIQCVLVPCSKCSMHSFNQALRKARHHKEQSLRARIFQRQEILEEQMDSVEDSIDATSGYVAVVRGVGVGGAEVINLCAH